MPPQQLDKVEVASTTSSGERAVVAGKVILGRRLLERSNASKVHEVLLRDPAISVSPSGRIGLLGLPGYTEVLLDGEPPPLGLDPLALPPAQVERIEIIRGSSADTGLAAIAGSINVVRRAQRRALPFDASGELGAPAHHRSASLSAQTVWKDEASGDTLGLSFNASSSRTLERSSVQERSGAPDPTAPGWQSSVRNLGRYDSLNLALRAGLKAGPKDSVNVSTSLVSADLGPTVETTVLPQAGSRLARPSRSLSVGRWRVWPSLSHSLEWEREAEQGGVWQLRADAALEKSRLSSSGSSLWDAEGPQALANRDSSERSNGQLRLVRRGWELGEHKLQAGLEAQQERRTESRTSFDASGGGSAPSFIDSLFSPTAVARSRYFSAWLQDEWQWNEDLSLKLGLRGEHRLHRLDEGASRTESPLRLLAPSLNGTWIIGEEGNHALSFGLSRGFKLPPAPQLSVRPRLDPTTPCESRSACGNSRPQAPDRAGNPALQPERSWGLDLNLEANVREHSAMSLGFALRWIDALVGEATRFESVAWSTEPRWVARPVNLGRARSHAISLGFSLVPRDWWPELPKSLEVTAALNWAGSSVSTVPGPDNRLPDQAPFTARLGLKYVAQSLPLEGRIDGLLNASNQWQDASGLLRQQTLRRAWSIAGTWSFSPKQQVTLKASNLPGEARLTQSQWPSAGLQLREQTRIRPAFSLAWVSGL